MCEKKVSRITSKAPSVLIWFRNRGLIVSLNVSLNNFLFSNFQYFAGDVDSDQDGLTDAVDDDDDNDGIPDNREYLQNILLLASPSTSVTFLLNISIKEKMDKTEWKLLDVKMTFETQGKGSWIKLISRVFILSLVIYQSQKERNLKF